MKKIALLLPDQFFASSVTALVDLLHITNGCWGRDKPPLFCWQLLSATGDAVISSSGLKFAVEGDFSRAADADVIYLPGVGYRDLAEYERRLSSGSGLCARILAWQREGRLLAGNCTGVAWLAQSGVLNGEEATVSWWLSDWFRRRYPAVKLRAHAVLVEAGNLLTSGAATSHHNLGLRLVERFAGADLAMMCARLMLVDIRRESQAPYANFQQYFGHGDALIARSQQWLQQRLAEPFRLDELARAVGASERTLIRRFRVALGDTPLHYLQQLRLHAARRLLETTSLGLEQIVAEVGYSDVSTFRRLFKRELACTPGEYRRAGK
ncbi:GlxA family transcriptional regulator [Niveibacterium terrae]|uniref:GlxA family transcriptional regulator n=1 Tax=Niveibacterium terrae TaxID=3373598 RepID=UPI003A93D4FF